MLISALRFPNKSGIDAKKYLTKALRQPMEFNYRRPGLPDVVGNHPDISPERQILGDFPGG
jgi:hypothetical protein